MRFEDRVSFSLGVVVAGRLISRAVGRGRMRAEGGGVLEVGCLDGVPALLRYVMHDLEQRNEVVSKQANEKKRKVNPNG